MNLGLGGFRGGGVGGEMLDGKASVAKDKPSIDKLCEDYYHLYS